VLGEVVLQTGANVGEGAVVTAGTRRDVADVLMGEAGRNVRTQADTRGAEVVDGVQRGQVALDVLVAIGAEGVFGGHVVVFAVRQGQGNVVGQVVTYRAAVQVAVLEVARTVSEVTL